MPTTPGNDRAADARSGSARAADRRRGRRRLPARRPRDRRPCERARPRHFRAAARRARRLSPLAATDRARASRAARGPGALQRARRDRVAPAEPLHRRHALGRGRIGRTRSATAYNVRSFVDAGAHVAFGTDWFVAPLNPMLGLYAAVTRQFADGAPGGGGFRRSASRWRRRSSATRAGRRTRSSPTIERAASGRDTWPISSCCRATSSRIPPARFSRRGRS